METVFSGKSVLLVEKSLQDLQDLRVIVTELGFSNIQVASSVNMALSILREQTFDCCLITESLGDREKTGTELLQELRAEGNWRFSTSYFLVLNPSAEALLLGAPGTAPDGYIAKPFLRHVMQQRIEKVQRLKKALVRINEALDAGRTEFAIEQCILHENHYPGLSTYLRRLRAILHLQMNEPFEAYALFRQLVQDGDDPWRYVGLAQAALACGNFEHARQQLEHLSDKETRSVDVLVLLARLFVCEGELKLAQIQLRKAVQLQPTNAVLHADLAAVAARNDDQRTATSSLRGAIELSRFTALMRPEWALGLVSILQLSQDSTNTLREEALRLLELVVEDFTQPEVRYRAWLLRAKILLTHGQTEQGMQALKSAIGFFCIMDPVLQSVWIDSLQELPPQAQLEEIKTHQIKAKQVIAASEWGKTLTLAVKTFRAGQLEHAAELFEAVMQAQPQHQNVKLNFVQAALESVAHKATKDPCYVLAKCATTLEVFFYPALSERQQVRFNALAVRLSELINTLKSNGS